MDVQKLHYENISGLLIRREGALSWRCPLCKTEGQSSEVMRCCPVCGSEEAAISGAQPAPSLLAEAIIADMQAQHDSELITENDSGEALIRLDGAIAAVEDNFAQPAPSVPEGWKEVEFPRKVRAVAVGWETKCARLEQERDALRAKIDKLNVQSSALLKALLAIADWNSAWGTFPEKNEHWRAMAIVTAREATKAFEQGEQK